MSVAYGCTDEGGARSRSTTEARTPALAQRILENLPEAPSSDAQERLASLAAELEALVEEPARLARESGLVERSRRLDALRDEILDVVISIDRILEDLDRARSGAADPERVPGSRPVHAFVRAPLQVIGGMQSLAHAPPANRPSDTIR